MDKNALWKWLILLAMVVGSIWVVTPIKKKVKFGLDLVGGTSVTVQVDTTDMDDDARQDAQERALEIIRNRIDSRGIGEPIIYPEEGNRIVVQIPGLSRAERDAAIDSIKQIGFLEFRMVHRDNDTLVEALFAADEMPEGYKIVRIQEKSRGRTFLKRDKEAVPEAEFTEEHGKRARRFKAPTSGVELLLMKDRDHDGLLTPVYVMLRAHLTGKDLKTAGVDMTGAMGMPVVTLKFDSKGAKRFSRLTKDYAPGGPKNPNPQESRRLAIVLDGTLYTAPGIEEAIRNGEAIIRGDFSYQEARSLMIVLRAGALPAPVTVMERRDVDPSLGEDSVRSGRNALMYGAAAVLVFMTVYYLMSGVVANLALALNFVLLPFGMMVVSGILGLMTAPTQASSQLSLPVLTLPGIAGIVLMVGMAVDANVLIFERIREEYRVGKRINTALAAGYDKAFVTILDANMTTLLTALILFWQGSGPIRGFAVTLSAGILISMFTSLVVTRLLFGIMIEKFKISSLKMLCLLKDPRIDFLGKRTVASVLSALVIVGSLTAMVVKGHRDSSAVLGVDFTGGASVTYAFGADAKPSIKEVRQVLESEGIRDTFIQYQRELDTGREYLEIKAGFGFRDDVKKAVESGLSAAAPRILKEDSVGPQIGAELKKRGILAIIWALVGIVLYVTWRFEFGFAIGAIVALAHDVLITVGLYTLCGRQLSLPVIAALLTIVGYSVNDTIVVFDRVREDRKLMRGKSLLEICNLSINQTLSRTLITSFTTLLTVVMLLVFGGGAINDFALTLFIGVIVGTYSSIFIATPVMLLFHRVVKAKKIAR